MPLYEFACVDCGERFEVLSRVGESSPACPRCGSHASERLLSTFAVTHAQPRAATGLCGSAECACRSRSED